MKRGCSSWLVAALLCSIGPLKAVGQPCPCDCNGNGQVAVNEMILAANIALELGPSSLCPAALLCTGDTVCIEGLVTCVGAALHGCSGPATPTRTETPLATPSPSELEVAMQNVFDETCFPFGIISYEDLHFDGDRISYVCSESPGHDSDGTLRRYADESAAVAAFDELAAGDWQHEQFHEFSALFRASSQGDGFFRESLVWRAGCWLIQFNAFDDTHFLYISPQPREVSEAVYATALAALLSECPP